MKNKEANEIIACLPKGKTFFYYFKDRYAIMLLSYFLGDGKPIREIKRSKFGKLLNKPSVGKLIDKVGDGILTPDALSSAWPSIPECYLLTLGEWGKKSGWSRYYQTSTPGVNLVLQLNFSSKHNKPYYKLIQPSGRGPFEIELHPIARRGFHTLAWSRLDIDLNLGEALIEEIQSDWITLATRGKKTIETYSHDEHGQRRIIQRYFKGLNCDPKALEKYINSVLSIHMNLWDEAMLSATIWFLKEELGIRHIYYHTYETGNLLKGLYGRGYERKPPKSIYTTLPKQFCFEKTDNYPNILKKCFINRFGRFKSSGKLKKNEKIHFWYLEV